MTVVRVLDGEVAKYFPVTGLMLVSSSTEAFLEGLRSNDDADGFSHRVTFYHEQIHHIQTLSSSYLWRDSLIRLTSSELVMFPRTHEERRYGALALLRAGRAMRERVCGVSITDLCEGVAVLESFKRVSATATPEEYIKFRNHYFPGKGNSVYRRTFDILADLIGASSAFDLLPVITWLALQGDIPGRAFAMLACSAEMRGGRLVGQSAKEITSALGYRTPFPRPLEIHQFPSALKHPTLYPILAKLCAEIDALELMEAFARPSGAEHLAFWPPLTFGAHRLGVPRSLAMGIAQESFDLRQKMAACTAIAYAAEQIVNGFKTSHIPCPHTQCINFTSKLCAGWFVPAVSADACGLRVSTAKRTSGKELHQIAAECASLHDDPEFAELRETHDVRALFPSAETIELDGDIAELGERFDQKFALDPEDNDALVVMFCRKCGTQLQIWASNRRMRAGFVQQCSCGAQLEFLADRATSIRLDETD